MATSAVLTPDGVDSLITADEAAQLCGVTAITIRNWANRGYVGADKQRHQLPVAGRDKQGRNQYRVIDVAKAEHATRARARRA